MNIKQKPVDIDWIMNAYDKRKGPQKLLFRFGLSLAALFIITIIFIALLLGDSDQLVLSSIIIASSLLSIFGLIILLKRSINEIKELAEIERAQSNLPQLVVIEYISLLKATTFQMREPKKKVQEFKEFLEQYNKNI